MANSASTKGQRLPVPRRKQPEDVLPGPLFGGHLHEAARGDKIRCKHRPHLTKLK